jgi:hypothetical protein
MPGGPNTNELRERFRDAWTQLLDNDNRFHSSRTLELLKDLRCIKTTINVGTKVHPRYLDFWGTPNDVVFILQSFGYDNGTQARGVYLDYSQFEEWYINHVRVGGGGPGSVRRARKGALSEDERG